MQGLPASYTDSFDHSFDGKGRITVPSEWRGEGFESRLYVFPTSQKHLRVYPASWLAEKQATAMKRPFDDLKRKMFEDLVATVQATSFDAQGRIMVKDKLRKGAGIETQVTLVGRSEYFQIWDRATYEGIVPAQPSFEDAMRGLDP